MRHYFRRLGSLVKEGLALLLVLPYLMRYRLRPSQKTFMRLSEALSLKPYSLGMMMRREFYRRILRSCGENAEFGFGVVLNYPDISIGSNVGLHRYTNLGLVDIGNDVMIASRCSLLSGGKIHEFSDLQTPIRLQPVSRSRLVIGDNVWIGAGSIVMADVASGSVVGAGSVVTRPVEGNTVVAGNPARQLKKRE